MTRIKTDRVRGGALRVLNDGLIGRSKKLLKRIEKYNLEGWEWLHDVHGAVQKGESGDDAAEKTYERSHYRAFRIINAKQDWGFPTQIWSCL